MSVDTEQSEVYPEEGGDIDSDNDLEVEDEPVQEAPAVDIQYNDKAQKSYLKYKFPIPDDVDRYERRFLEDVDTRNGPITRKVYKVIRVRGKDNEGKSQDYLYYFERWDGFDYLGNELDPVPEHIEGKYDEVQIKYNVDKKGRPIKSEPRKRGTKTKFYIPFSKKTLDKILKDVEKDSIEYVVKIGDEKGNTRRDNTFSYEQFANLPYADLIKLSFQPGGPRATPYVPTTAKK